MGKFTFIETGIKDLYVIEPTVFGDNRGYFMETYNDEFKPYIKHLDGTPAEFVQDNQSKSKKGVLSRTLRASWLDAWRARFMTWLLT